MFQGFSGDTVDFLWGIRFNNERPWFEAHKEDYRAHLLAPMKELAGEVYDRFTEQCSDLALICKVSRIYRDARRLFGRGPYKDHLWLSVHRPEERPGACVGCGFEHNCRRDGCAVLRKVSRVVAEREEKHHEQNENLD